MNFNSKHSRMLHVKQELSVSVLMMEMKNIMKKKIFDTSSLLLISKDFFEKEENPIIITNITLKELENIKTSS